ncbi:MAG: hypothetical protein FWD36_04585 [Treponema sp.]|nr:hypothetical protein [Treponema sp.]
MKRLWLVLLGGLLLNTIAYAQLGDRIQRGKATQEMEGKGFLGAHFNIPIDATVRVINADTQMEITILITGRIPASASRIIDLSKEAYDALGLKNDTTVIVSYTPQQHALPAAPPEPSAGSEMPRLNTAHAVYHVLILDRKFCRANATLEGLENIRILYQFTDRSNGYLIAVYVSSSNGPVFPKMPNNSRIVANMTTSRRELLLDYVISRAFITHVTNPRVRTGVLDAVMGL